MKMKKPNKESCISACYFLNRYGLEYKCGECCCHKHKCPCTTCLVKGICKTKCDTLSEFIRKQHSIKKVRRL